MSEGLATTALPARQPPSVRQMLGLWVPLAASIVMMVLEPSTINIALGRTLDPELALAAYGVAFSLALLVEAPIIMLLDASVAKSTDVAAFALVRRFTVGLGLAVTALGLIVSMTPLYSLVVERLMGIPHDVAARARPTLQILSFWPLPIAWRRAHQGVLIRAGRTGIITIATAIRLLALASALFAGMQILPDRGSVVAGLAMDFSVSIEAIVITWATRRVLPQGRFGFPDEESSPSPDLGELWRFYRPLVATTLLRQVTRPALNTGIAVAALARSSLAAWPVVWGFAILISGPAWSIQQLTTALAVDRPAYHAVRRFTLMLCAVLTLVLVFGAFTPLYSVVMGGVYNLSADLAALARPAVQWMVVLPLLTGAQSVLRGALIRAGRTSVVRTAMLINVTALVASMVASVALLRAPGVTLAAIATLIGGLAELAWLAARRQW